jgi:Ca2+-transporting ATPase
MGLGGFLVFYWLLAQGSSEEQARNLLLLLFVLFENVQTFNSRSERHSVFRQGLGSNPLLVLGVMAALGIHVGAMYLPGLSEALRISPVSFGSWSLLLLPAVVLLGVMEFEKWWDYRLPGSYRADALSSPDGSHKL